MLNSIGTTIVSVVAFAIIARLITRADMGILAVLLLASAGIQVLDALGVGAAATRFVASFEASRDYDKVRRVAYEALTISGSLAVVFAAVVYLFANVLSIFLFGNLSNAILLKLLPLQIIGASLGNSFFNILTGLRKFKELSIFSLASFAVRQGLVVLLLELGWGLSGVVIGWGVGDGLGALLLGISAIRRLGRFGLGFGVVRLLRFSAPLFFGEGATYAWGWFDRALLLSLVPLAQLGSYNVAVTAYTLLNSLPSAISGTLFPFYSRFYPHEYAAPKTSGLENAVRTASRYVSLFTIPLSVGMAATALPAVTLLAGGIYADAAVPLAVLSMFLAIACQVRALSQIFIVLGKPVTSALVTIASTIIPVMLGPVMILNMGTVGASLTRGLSLLIALLASILILRRLIRLEFDMKAYVHAWVASGVMAVVVVLAQLIYYNKYLLPVYVMIGGLIFILGLRMLRTINRDDAELVSEFLPRRFRFVSIIMERVLGLNLESSSA